MLGFTNIYPAQRFASFIVAPFLLIVQGAPSHCPHCPQYFSLYHGVRASVKPLRLGFRCGDNECGDDDAASWPHQQTPTTSEHRPRQHEAAQSRKWRSQSLTDSSRCSTRNNMLILVVLSHKGHSRYMRARTSFLISNRSIIHQNR